MCANNTVGSTKSKNWSMIGLGHWNEAEQVRDCTYLQGPII